MAARASGTFEIDDWDERPVGDLASGATDAARVDSATVRKTFRGDLAGRSVTGILMARSAVEESAAYVGFERVTGTLHGRTGSFVMHHSA
nr:DUF3224 domain-containing protein [Micromonospora sp. DSM 115978]